MTAAANGQGEPEYGRKVKFHLGDGTFIVGTIDGGGTDMETGRRELHLDPASVEVCFIVVDDISEWSYDNG